MTEHDLLKVPEVARLVRLKPDTVYALIRDGVWHEPLVVKFGRTIRISRPHLERVIAQGGIPLESTATTTDRGPVTA